MWIHLAAALLQAAAPPPTAEDLYRAGREELTRRGYEDLKRARESFLGAIAVADDFAAAHAGLAEACALLGDYPRAEEAALRAVELDPSLARGHATLAFVLLHAHWNWSRAASEFRTALALDPGDALVHHWHAIFLEAMGQIEQAVAAARTASELEPAVRAYALGVGYRLFWARRYEEAVEHFDRLLERDGDLTSAHYFLGRSLTELGRLRKARASLSTARRLAPRDLNVAAALGYLHARAGRRSAAAESLRELRRFSALGYPLSTQIASIYTARGDADAALDWLERAYRRREGPLVWLKIDPRFDALRATPRFTALLTKMQLSGETEYPVPAFLPCAAGDHRFFSRPWRSGRAAGRTRTWRRRRRASRRSDSCSTTLAQPSKRPVPSSAFASRTAPFASGAAAWRTRARGVRCGPRTRITWARSRRPTPRP